MPISEDFAKEIEFAVEQSISKSEDENSKETNEQSESKSVDDVETEAASGEDGNIADVGSDGDGSTDTTEESSEERDGEVGSIDTSSEESEATVTKPTISDAALTEAIRHGISLEDARLFPSESALGRAVQAIRKSIADSLPEEKQEEEKDPFLDIKPLPTDDDSYDEETVKSFNLLLDVVKKQHSQLKELRQKTDTVGTEAAQAQQVAVQREVTGWLDKQFEGLGNDFKDVIGAGNTESFAPGTSHRNVRDEIISNASAYLTGYRSMGIEKTRDEAFKVAAKAVLADKYEEASRKKLQSQVEKRNKMKIQRVGGSQVGKGKADPEQAAIEALQKRFPKLAK